MGRSLLRNGVFWEVSDKLLIHLLIFFNKLVELNKDCVTGTGDRGVTRGPAAAASKMTSVCATSARRSAAIAAGTSAFFRNPTNANTAAIIPTTKDSIEHSVELATPLVVWRTCACGQADLGQMTHIVFRRSAAAKGRGGLFQTKRN